MRKSQLWARELSKVRLLLYPPTPSGIKLPWYRFKFNFRTMHNISLCNIKLKKINYNKQKGYKNMILDMTCLHFSWMTFFFSFFGLTIKWVVSLSTELLTDTFQLLMQIDGALGESICLPSWKMLRFWSGLQWQQVFWCYLFNHQVKYSLHSHKSDQISFCENEFIWLAQHMIGTFHHYKKKKKSITTLKYTICLLPLKRKILLLHI